MTEREVTINRGSGMFEKQTQFTEVGRNWVHIASILVMLLVYGLALYITTALIGNFNVGVVRFNLSTIVLLVAFVRVSVVGGELRVRLGVIRVNKYIRLIMIGYGVLYSYLLYGGMFEYNYFVQVAQDGVGRVVLADTPFKVFYIPGALEWFRWTLAVVLPVALIVTADAFLWRTLTEMRFPSLANSIRSALVRLRGQAQITYPDIQQGPQNQQMEVPVMVVD